MTDPLHIKPTCVQVKIKDCCGSLLVFKPLWLINGGICQIDAKNELLPRQAYLRARRKAQHWKRTQELAMAQGTIKPYKITIEPMKKPGDEFEPLPGADNEPRKFK